MSDELKIKIDQNDITNMVRDAILAKLTDGQAQQFVREAVDNLLKRQSFGDRQTQVQEAFSDGARLALRDIVKVEFEKPERQAQLREVFVEAWTRMFDKDAREQLLDKLVDQMRKGLTGERY